MFELTNASYGLINDKKRTEERVCDDKALEVHIITLNSIPGGYIFPYQKTKKCANKTYIDKHINQKAYSTCGINNLRNKLFQAREIKLYLRVNLNPSKYTINFNSAMK